MSWLTLVSLLVRLALTIMQYVERQRTLQEGRERELKAMLEKVNELASNARSVRASVSDGESDILQDDFNRDRARGDKPGGDNSSGGVS